MSKLCYKCRKLYRRTMYLIRQNNRKHKKGGITVSKTFAEMQEMYRDVVKRFNKIELQEWKAAGAMIELSKQVGELAKQVMLKEKYYAFEGDESEINERLGNEMADVIAQVMRLADYYSIDLEQAFIDARADEDNYLTGRGV